MKKTDWKDKKPTVDKNSEFYDDPIRICKAKGHKLEKPHPRSSYYDGKKTKRYERCVRCSQWIENI